MCRKLFFLVSTVLLLGLNNIAFATQYELFKVDFSCWSGVGLIPKPETVKGGEWIDFLILGSCFDEAHDSRTLPSEQFPDPLNGTDIVIQVGGTSGDDWGGGAWLTSLETGDPICNTAWQTWESEGCEGGGADNSIRLAFRNLDPDTTYTVHTYHAWGEDGEINSVNPLTIVGADSNNILNDPYVSTTRNDNELLASDDVGIIEFTTDSIGSEVKINFNGCVRFNAFKLYGEVAPPRATNPNPISEEGTYGCPMVQLSWAPGADVNDANGHDVYLGTDINDVTDANRTDPCGVLVSQGQDSNEYPEDGDDPLQLDLMTTYYWRVDEINDTNTWAGSIWSFTTEDGNARDPEPADGLAGLPPDANVLTWTPSCVAVAQTVYFSTDFYDVNTKQPGAIVDDTLSGTDNNCPVGNLEKFTTYYWRIETTRSDDYGTGASEVWSFGTGLGGLVLKMLFEGSLGADLPATEPDTSGNALHFTTYSPVHDPCADGSVKYADGRWDGTSVAIDPNAGLYRQDTGLSDPLRLAGWQYSIQMWAYLPAEGYTETEEGTSMMMVGKQNGWRIQIHDPGQDDDIRWYHKLGTKYDAIRAEGILPEIFDEWVHIAAVFDKTAQETQKLYIDGTVVASGNYQGTASADNNSPVGIGVGVTNPPPFSFDMYFEGKIDELRIWDIALEPEVEFATQPYPPDGSIDLDPNDPNFLLSWKPGSEAVTHKVYFSTDFTDVNTGNPDALLPGSPYDTNEVNDVNLMFGRTYYWRVDEVNGLAVWPGHIWKFTTEFAVVDPNMIVWYKFDETSGEVVIDASGYGHHGDVDDLEADTWDPYDGKFYPGCIHFHEEERVDLDDDVFDYIGESISISVWWKDAWRSGDENHFCAFGDDDLHLLVRAPDSLSDNPGVIWQAGNDTNDVLEWITNGHTWKDDWHHLVFTKNGPEGTMKIYFDALLVDSITGANSVTLGQAADNEDEGFRIGADWEEGDSFAGKADDFRLYDYELPQDKIDELSRGGNVDLAWSPDPYDGEVNVPWDANLVWKPGDDANSHKVFFGTSEQEVTDMVVPVAVKELGDEDYDPCLLELGTFYYWRIDEVNNIGDSCTWPGPVWSFKVADYVAVDDFEVYNKTTNQIHNTWRDYQWQSYNTPGKETGALLGLGIYPYSVVYPGGGGKSMMYTYLNYPCAFGWCPPGCGEIPLGYGILGAPYAMVYYSEAWLPMPEELQDWTAGGVRVLRLFFYGGPDNDANDSEQMFVGVTDGDGDYAEVRYGDYDPNNEDMNDVNEAEWHRWDIGLTHFKDSNFASVANDVNLTNIAQLHIGFGNKEDPLNPDNCGGQGIVIFDDIRLQMPICKPEFGPIADFSGNCIVDMADVGMMAEAFLRHDVNFSPAEIEEPNDANLVGWWRLDNDACDSSIYDHNSGVEGTYAWVTGHNDVNEADLAVQFGEDGGRVLVPDDNNTPELRPKHQVSVSTWVYFTQSQDSARVVVKGENDKETYAIEIDGKDKFNFLVRDVNGNKYSVPEDDDDDGDGRNIWTDDWIHLAGTYDGNTVKSYVNGELFGSTDANFVVAKGWTLSQDTTGLAIGSKAEELDDEFEGTVDEVRVYNYALSQAEVAWLATDGTGYIPLVLPYNLYDKEVPGKQAINFKDYAMLLEDWLEERLWPPE